MIQFLIRSLDWAIVSTKEFGMCFDPG